MAARKKKDSGKQAMLNESKALEAKGKRQKAGVPPDEAPEMPARMAKGTAALEGVIKGKKGKAPAPKHKKK